MMTKEEAYKHFKNGIYEMFKKGDLKIHFEEDIDYGYGSDPDYRNISIQILDDKDNILSTSDNNITIKD